MVLTSVSINPKVQLPCNSCRLVSAHKLRKKKEIVELQEE